MYPKIRASCSLSAFKNPWGSLYISPYLLLYSALNSRGLLWNYLSSGPAPSQLMSVCLYLCFIIAECSDLLWHRQMDRYHSCQGQAQLLTKHAKNKTTVFCLVKTGAPELLSCCLILYCLTTCDQMRVGFPGALRVRWRSVGWWRG